MGLRGIFELIKSRYVAILLYTSGLTNNLIVLSRLNISPITFALAEAGAFFATVAAYILSDLLDLKEDVINSPNRPLPSGRATPRDAKILIGASLIIAIISGSLINTLTALLIFLSFILSSLYSMPFVRGKEKYYAKSSLSWLGGFVGTFTAMAVLKSFSIVGLMISAMNGTLIMLLVMIGDIIDYDGDKASGVNSLAVKFGRETALKFMTFFLFILILLVTAIVYADDFIHPVYLFVSITAVSFVYLSFRKLKKNNFEKRTAKMVKQYLRGLYFIEQLSLALSVILSIILLS